MTPTVWLVRSNTNPMLFAFATKDAANDYIAGHPASIAGGMYATEAQVFGAPAPAPDDVALVDGLIKAASAVGEHGWSADLERVREFERVLLARLSRAPSVPEGWKLVPVEPTCEMVNAANDTGQWEEFGYDCAARLYDVKEVYAAMLAAAPKVPG